MVRARGKEPGINVTTCIPLSIYQKLVAECEKTCETRSALVASLVIMCFEDVENNETEVTESY